MKGIFFFIFFLLFVQQPFAFAKELSFYEEFDYQPEVNPKDAGEKETANRQNEHAEKDSTVLSVPADSVMEVEETVTEFNLSDEKHVRFLRENEQYALADAMLNLTWNEVIKTLNRKQYRALWNEHKKWMKKERNTIADNFREKFPEIPEEYAFMLTAAAKTQELAQRIWHSPVTGIYKKGDLQIVLLQEDGSFFVQGYGEIPQSEFTTEVHTEDVTKNAGNHQNVSSDIAGSNALSMEETEKKNVFSKEQNREKKNSELLQKNRKNTSAAQNINQLIFRAKLPKQGKFWLVLSSMSGQKFYLLTMNKSLCLIHTPNIFPLDFNGVFIQK